MTRKKNCYRNFFCNENHVFDAKTLEKSKICNNNFEKNINNKKKRR